jgi:hypothetical protein
MKKLRLLCLGLTLLVMAACQHSDARYSSAINSLMRDGFKPAPAELFAGTQLPPAVTLIGDYLCESPRCRHLTIVSLSSLSVNIHELVAFDNYLKVSAPERNKIEGELIKKYLPNVELMNAKFIYNRTGDKRIINISGHSNSGFGQKASLKNTIYVEVIYVIAPGASGRLVAAAGESKSVVHRYARLALME